VLEAVPATVKAISLIVGTVKETVAELPERRALESKLPKLHTRVRFPSPAPIPPRPVVGRCPFGTHAMNRRIATALVLLGGVALPAAAQVDQLLQNVLGKEKRLLAPQEGVSEGKAGAGLKEALQVAAEKSVSLTGRPDGYFANEAIRIPMPEKLHAIEKGLRLAGYGSQADEFVLSMNRAAEASAPAARRIFVDAIRGMSFDDARRILGGGDTAATEFFQSRTTDKLTAAFTPVVKRSLGEVGTTRQFEALMARVDSLPFLKSQAFDLDAYVVGKALDGLFHVMGEQEREIRTNPAARTTELLKEVFAGR
jgi:hypothetical protein